MIDEEDLRDVIAEERSRGRRPVDTAELKKRRELRARLRRVLSFGDRGALVKILKDAGHAEGSEEFRRALRVFDELTRPR